MGAQDSLATSLEDQLAQEVVRLQQKQAIELEAAEAEEQHTSTLSGLAAQKQAEEAALEAEFQAEQEAIGD